jgi:hypothetical protein
MLKQINEIESPIYEKTVRANAAVSKMYTGLKSCIDNAMDYKVSAIQSNYYY